MPTNRAIHISPIIEEVKWINPGSILDVGIGYGVMGSLFRMATDIRKSERNPESFHSWPTRIDGIEIFEWYRNPAWNMYTNVYIGNALDTIKELPKYDFVYCGDMIEHISKEHGELLIDLMLEHANKWVHIATPSPAPPQGEILGNPNEEHVSEWTQQQFEDFAQKRGYLMELVGNFYSERDNMLVVRIKKHE